METERPRTAVSLRSERAFRARIAELGGTVLEPKWLGVDRPHRVLCVAGHEGAPRPSDVRQGDGICKTCAGTDPRAAEAAFRARVDELGGSVLEPTWLGAAVPHRVRCAVGHEGQPRPNDVRKGKGICRTCAGQDPATAERAFRARVAELGGTVLEPIWLGVSARHRVRCAAGHEGKPKPNDVQQGRGICRACAGKDPVAAEEAFRARVVELGGVVLESTWLGKDVPHRVRCAAGHEGGARPGNVRQGEGICRTCSGKVWNAFYVVADDINDHLKFGITSGDPRPRLQDHERDGFDRVVRLLTDLPEGVAHALERSVLATLRLAGEQPVRGREYFDMRAMATVLDVVDHHSTHGARQ